MAVIFGIVTMVPTSTLLLILAIAGIATTLTLAVEELINVIECTQGNYVTH